MRVLRQIFGRSRVYCENILGGPVYCEKILGGPVYSTVPPAKKAPCTADFFRTVAVPLCVVLYWARPCREPCAKKPSTWTMSARQTLHVAVGSQSRVAAILIAVAAAIEGFARLPVTGHRDVIIDPSQQAAERAASKGVPLVVIIHGLNGAPTHWPAALTARLRSKNRQAVVTSVDWSEIATSKLRGAATASAIGATLGQCFATIEPPLVSVHVVSHSVGAHAAASLAASYRAGGGRAPLRLTYLDPFCMKGVLDWRYGVRAFGLAEYVQVRVEHVYDSQSAPPTTGVAIRHAAQVIDVSSDPGRAKWKPQSLGVPNDHRRFHWWPTEWYISNYPLR